MARSTKDENQIPPTDAPEPSPETDATNAPEPTIPEPPVLLFVGDFLSDGRPAHFLRNVPARDLTQSEVDELGPEHHKAALKSGLYRDAKEAS